MRADESVLQEDDSPAAKLTQRVCPCWHLRYVVCIIIIYCIVIICMQKNKIKPTANYDCRLVSTSC